jgi:undecaprenyl-diphosphatase
MRSLDEGIFRWINGWPDSWTPFFRFLSEGNKETAVRVALGLIVLGMLVAGPRSRKAALLALAAWALANGFTEALKNGLGMPRPSVELPDAIFRVKPLTSPGTASSHAANMMAVAVVFTAFFRWRGAPWLALAFLVGLSRIYVGVHYPSQVLLGWICGALCAFVAMQTWAAFVRLRTARAESPGPATTEPSAANTGTDADA